LRIIIIVFSVFAASLFFIAAVPPFTPKAYHIDGRAQGTTFSILYYAESNIVSKHEIDSIFNEIDHSLSIYKPNTLISEFNKSSTGIVMDKHFRKVVLKSIEIFKKSAGAFDITIYPLVQIWGFGTEKVASFPDSASIASSMRCVGSEKIKVKGKRLIKSEPCVKINVNAIAPGYTSDLISTFLEKKGIKTYVVEVGGEIRVKGKKPDGNYMSVGIEGPSQDSLDGPLMQHIIQMKEGAITTSGNSRQYREEGGKKASHLLDARTGYPLTNELISVTVIAKDAMTADGYDNVLMVLGLEEAFRFVKKQKNMEAYFIYHKADGSVADTATVGFYRLLK
jgi:thiamine biosynthesis lipoprotein